MNPLSESDIQTLLLLLDDMRGTSKIRQRQPPNPTIKNMEPDLARTARLLPSHYQLGSFADMIDAGKRETGKRSPKSYELEQPMNFDNALYPGDRLEFLNQKRSKRIGARNLMVRK